MAGSLNQVSLIGNLGADPDVRILNSGDPVVSLRIATSESWTDKQTNEKKERTEWHTVVIFNKGLAGVAEKYLKKGMKLFVQGQLSTREWQDHQGQRRWSTEVVLRGFDGKLEMLGGGGERPAPDPNSYGSTSSSTGNASGNTSGSGNFSRDLDDEIPF